MNEEKSFVAMCKFLSWLCFSLFITFFGLSHALALTYTDIGYVHTLSGVNGEVTIDVTYETENNAPLVINRNQVVYTQLKVMNVFVSGYSFEANRQYQIEMEFPNQQLQYANTYQVFGLNNELCQLSYTYSVFNSQWPRWNFSCPHATNGIYLKVYNSNNSAITSYGNWSWNYIYLRYTNSPIETDVQDTDVIINNNNQNTDRIIENNNQNTQSIINSNKENFQTCRQSYNLFSLDNKYLDYPYSTMSVSGTNKDFTISSSNDFGSRAYLIGLINYPTIYKYLSNSYVDYSISLYYTNDNNYTTWSDYSSARTAINGNWSSNSNGLSSIQGKYLWIQLRGDYNGIYSSVNYKDLVISKVQVNSYEEFGEEICTNKIDDVSGAVNDLNDTVNDDDVSGATDEASDFFSDFSTNTFGLTSIITAPLTLIQSLTSSSCTTLHLPLPYLDNKYLDLPCMSTIYQSYFGTFFTLYQTITYGIIAYWVCVRIFNQVKDFKNPEHDEIEVVDL